MPPPLWFCPLCQEERSEPGLDFCPNDGARLRPIGERGAAWIGKVLDDKYRIVRFIDAGGMAEVYEAERLANGKHVAVKLLHAALAASSAMLERFRDEGRLVSRIAHPNVAAIEDFGTLPDAVHYMVLELLEGRPLSAELAGGPIPVLAALRYAIQTCEGLAAAHARDIVHCDIKPENLFLQRVPGEDAPVLKILDLGIGRLLADAAGSKHQGVIDGTPAYMSPEQVLGHPLGPATDIYSLGVLLYELLLGRLPFEGASIRDVLTKHVQERPVWPAELSAARGVPPEAEAIVLRALEKEPGARQGSMLDLQRELASVVRAIRARKVSVRPNGPHTKPSMQASNGAKTQPHVWADKVPLSSATGADAEVVALARDVYWVGRRHNRFLECNAYLRVFRRGDASVSVLVDPGPPKDLDIVRAKVAAVIGAVGRLDYLFINHQDPDVASNAAAIQQASSRARMLCSEDTFRLAQFYGLDPRRFTAVESLYGGRMSLATGHELVFVPTPFCHFRGAVMLYDPESRVLFTGDLFGGAQSSALVAGAASWPGIEMFHQIYMPSRRALSLAVSRIRALDPPPLMLAPQHGAIIVGDDVAPTLDKIDALEVGLDLLGADGDERFVVAANEIVREYSELVGVARTRELLMRCSADGTFTNPFVLDGPDTIASFKIAAPLALQRLAGDALASLPPAVRGDLQRTIRTVSRRHGLEGTGIAPFSARMGSRPPSR